MAIGGTIAFFLSLSGVPAFDVFENPRNQGHINSWIVSFANTTMGMSTAIRYSGFFDEPGAFGCWAIFALVTNQLFVKDKRLEYFLIPLGLLSFSFAFMIQLTLFLVLFKINWRKRSNSILILILFFTIAYLVYNTQGTEYSFLYDSSFGRFNKIEMTGEGVMMNDLREEMADNTKRFFLESPIIGVGPNILGQFGSGVTDNPYETLANVGIVGTIITYLPLLYLIVVAIRRNDKELLFGLVVLGVGFLQRPLHQTVVHIFMVYAIVYTYTKQTRIKRLRV